MKERKTLRYAALIIFAVSFLLLVTAMILHAALGDEQAIVVAFAAASAFVAVVGIVCACLSRVRIKK